MYKLIIVSLIALGALFGYSQYSAPTSTTPQTFGDFNPTGGTTYRLQSSIGTTDTTIRLSSFKEPGSNIPYTMAYLNSSIEYGTLDPQTSTREFVSFTGITQNSNGTATLTGVTRGLANTPAATGSDCTTASSTLRRAHAGQSIFILSDSPCLFAEYAVKRNAETISGIWTYSSTSPPRLDQPGAQGGGSVIATTSEFATVRFVLMTTLSGAANASEGVKGIVDLATALQQASSTSAGVVSSFLVLQSRYATDTPQRGCAVGYTATAGAGCTVIAQLTGKIRQTWINLTEAYTWTALHTFSGGLTSTGTTTISASNINTNPIVLNGLGYTFFGTRAASSTVLTENGSGGLRFITPQQYILAQNTAVNSGTSATATTSLSTITIPGSTLTALVGSVSYKSFWTMTSGDTCNFQVDIGTGTATSSVFQTVNPNNSGSRFFTISGSLIATSSTSVMAETVLHTGNSSVASATTGADGREWVMPVTINTANPIYISLAVRSAAGSNTCTLNGYTANVERF